MKHLLLTTALVTATAAGVHAQSTEATTDTGAAATTMSGDMFRADSTPDELRASDFLGMRVFASAEGAAEDAYEAAQDNWEDIGEINDVILNRDGEVQAVLVDIGGFLGIGERQIAVQMDALDFVSDSSTAENEGDFFLVLTADRATLEGAPAYGQAADEAMAEQTAATATDEEATDMAASDDAAAASGATMTETADAAAPAAEAEEELETAESEVEQAGEEIEQTAENAAEETGEAIEQTAEATGDAAAEAGEEVEQTAENAVEETGEAIEQTAEATGDAAAEAGEEIEQTAEAAGEEIEQTAEAAGQEMEEAGEEMTDTAEATMPEADAEADAEVTATADADAGELTTMEEGSQTAMNDGGALGDFQPEGYAAAGADYMTTENLTGARVYDTNDKWVGEISELLINDQGEITDAIVDIGGFLGIGEKPVALQLSDLKILQQQDSGEVRIYTAMAEEELEAMPEFQD